MRAGRPTPRMPTTPRRVPHAREDRSLTIYGAQRTVERLAEECIVRGHDGAIADPVLTMDAIRPPGQLAGEQP